jgi:NAD(P)-dependent dehydrogenase (short-subunit alcohol dehydrogenase family)
MSERVCAIVGAGEGLGRALAAKFAGEGFDIALISRSETSSRAAADAAAGTNAGAKVRFFAADAVQPETIERAVARTLGEMGEVEVLIYNVRSDFTPCVPLAMTYAQLDEVYRLEVVGAFAAAKSVLPTMRERGHGSLFFSSATAALRGSAKHPLYAIGKFGLRALSQSLAKAYSKDGVHIVHFRLDCDLDVPVMRELYGDKYDPEKMANPADVAEAYWLAYQQPRSAWSNEVELRPYTEVWSC